MVRKSILVIVAICSFNTWAIAQQSSLTLNPLIAPSQGRITIQHFADRDASVMALFLTVNTNQFIPRPQLYFGMKLLYPGTRLLLPPQSVSVDLGITCREGMILRKAEPEICIDGKCRQYAVKAYNTCDPEKSRSVSVGSLIVPFADLQEIKKGSQVTIRLDDNSYVLSEGQVGLARGFVAQAAR